MKGWENNSDFMVKKEITSPAKLKKELEEAKAELVSRNKKLKLSVKTEAKKKVDKKKAEAKKKVDKKKAEAKKKEEAKKKAEEAKKKEEETKKKEEEAKRTYEEELEEQLTEDEIKNFAIDKTDMDKLVNRVTEMIAGYATNGILQNILWRKLKLSSRDGSRLALKLEKLGNITREKILENGRWTYLLLIKKIPISTTSIENAPCLVCPVEGKCSTDGEISPKTCVYIEDWVLTELKTKKRHETD